MDAELREKISAIQFACWSDMGKHTPESSSCQECNNQITNLVQQEIAKAKLSGIRLGMNVSTHDAMVEIDKLKLSIEE